MMLDPEVLASVKHCHMLLIFLTEESAAFCYCLFSLLVVQASGKGPLCNLCALPVPWEHMEAAAEERGSEGEATARPCTCSHICPAAGLGPVKYCHDHSCSPELGSKCCKMVRTSFGNWDRGIVRGLSLL